VTAVPAHLSPEAAAVWAELVTELGGIPVNTAAFGAYCVQVARLRDAQGRIDREGLVVADEKGRPVPHPAIAIEKAAQAEIRSWADRIKPLPPHRRTT
jgi:P27 family predicted phage terminase small subunit